MNNKINRKTTSYVIDSDFRLVYSNDAMLCIDREAMSDRHCYDVICGSPLQCEKCPLRKENNGKSVVFNKLRGEWVTVTASEINWPGAGDCHIIVVDSIDEQVDNFIIAAANQFSYGELIELNYLNDTYKIIYFGDHRKAKIEANGSISNMIHKIAENSLHQDDRKKFCEFWVLDSIGQPGIPEELLKTRHGEFRRQNPDGSYTWIQQMLMPMRKSSQNDIFVNNFYHELGTQSEEAAGYENDPVSETGLYNKTKFFLSVKEALEHSQSDICWSIISFDIEKFALYNMWYGEQAGTQLLMDISGFIRENKEKWQAVAGYFGNDDFAFAMPYDEEKIEQIHQEIGALLKSHSNKLNVFAAFGVYQIEDKTEDVFSMYERANIACASVKGNYAERIKKFDNAMVEQLEYEYLLFTDIQKALKNKEFTFYLQPKCNMKNGKIVGAEALVRWMSPEKGMISPGNFIPFLEKSGFISELDKYVWEKVCKWQRSMIDRGKNVVPVSVNVSRMDMYTLDVAEYFSDLIKKYELPANLIEIEITESIYADGDDFIHKTAANLRKHGFRVLMDDFGKAYSSLNLLSEIEVDVLKIDMHFLSQENKNKKKSVEILAMIRNMADMMGLGVVIEGVETKEEKNFLIEKGCIYGQGYYFYRPMSISDFEEIMKNSENIEDTDVYTEDFEHLHLKDFLNRNIISETMLSKVLGAVAFYDVCNNKITIARYNESYAALAGYNGFSEDIITQFSKRIFKDDFDKMLYMFNIARANKETPAFCDIRRRKEDGTVMWLHMKTFYLCERSGGHTIYYSTLSDVTDFHQMNETLRFFNDMPGGYYRYKNNADFDFVYVSQRFLDIFGYTREEIKKEFDDKFMNMVHPEDRPLVAQEIKNAEETDGNYIFNCRMMSKNGYIAVIDQSRLVKCEKQEVFQGIILPDYKNNEKSVPGQTKRE